ncbi:hypothetical protein [Oerskovia sp. Root22]|uniref:hypothetical protein n=1 Tax=Oerskovia sp. Root22 TaxID=1736494 RepID=UPI0006F51FAB|nr:hypothetical protein [Oerskovia sp. Root22]KRC31663.1 hypothetical protein ASE15_17695 [Oerskovia sp. Root22]
MLPDTDVAAAATTISTLFSGVAAHPVDRGCGRCFSDEESALLCTPDAPLPDDLVLRVAAKDPLHWADQPAIVRRVLPQLVVLLVDGVDLDARWCARGLAAARWSTWPADESEAVEAFLNAWWTHTLRSGASFERVAEVFMSCAIASLLVDPWLATWDEEAARSSVVRERRDSCVEDWWEDLDRVASPFPCWWGTDESEERAAETLQSWMGCAERPVR